MKAIAGRLVWALPAFAAVVEMPAEADGGPGRAPAVILGDRVFRLETSG